MADLSTSQDSKKQLERIKERFDLLAEVEKDIGPGKKSGRWVSFHCPFPGHKNGDRNPSLAVTPDNGRFHCFTCGRSGDVIAWMRDYREMTWKEIFGLADLADTGDLLEENPRPRPAPRPEPPGPPAAAWQERARAFVGCCEQVLWAPEGSKALDYLHRRGLRDETIRRYHLGYQPADAFEPLDRWGLVDPDSKAVWLPRGVVIPCSVAGVLWYVNIRRPAGEPKYHKIKGSEGALFGADSLFAAFIVLLCEGEFDCMLASQEIGDIAGCATLGGNATRLDVAAWGRYLLPARTILAAYDVDGRSENGLAKLARKSAQIHPVRVPALRSDDKDITDYYLAGGDLWEWLKYHLEQIGV